MSHGNEMHTCPEGPGLLWLQPFVQAHASATSVRAVTVAPSDDVREVSALLRARGCHRGCT